jgi:hypothetical protein
MNTVRRLITMVIATLLILAGCSGGGKIPGEGLAPTPETTTAVETPQEQRAPNFKEAYKFDDGVIVEVTKIKTGHLTRQEAAEEGEPKKVKPGAGYAEFSIRIKNVSKETLEIGEGVGATVNYGPEGLVARDLLGDRWYSSWLAGKILPGKAKTGSWAFLIPDQYWNDVVLEVSISDVNHTDREDVVFAGPIR